MTPTPVRPNSGRRRSTPRTSTDSDGTITKYEWDLDGDGTYEINAGTSKTTTKTYTTEGNVDGRPARHRQRRRDRPHRAHHQRHRQLRPDRLASPRPPNPVVVGPDRDLQRLAAPPTPTARSPSTSGTSTATGPTRPAPAPPPTTTKTYATAGTRNVGLRVTDNGGKTATATAAGDRQRRRRVAATATRCSTPPGCSDYWRLGETAGPDPRRQHGHDRGDRAAAASRSASPAAPPSTRTPPCASTGVSAPRRADSRPRRHEQADGRVLAELERLRQRRLAWRSSSPRTSTTTTAASSSTPTRRRPAAPSASRSAAAPRATTPSSPGPAAGTWHHYAIVLDTSAPAAAADHALRRRPAGDLHEDRQRHGRRQLRQLDALLHVARRRRPVRRRRPRRGRALRPRAERRRRSPTTTSSYGTNRRPVAAFSATPEPGAVNGRPSPSTRSASSDPDGTIAKYEWDLDGNGTYETDSGTSPTTQRSYATVQNIDVGLRVTDNLFGTDTETQRADDAATSAPVAAFSATPNPAHRRAERRASTPPPPPTPTARSPSTSGTSTATAPTRPTPAPPRRRRRAYTADRHGQRRPAGHRQRGRDRDRVVPVTINDGGVSNYGDAVLDTPGLVDYWRMGEAAGPTFADSTAPNHATAFRRRRRSASPARSPPTPTTPARFDGVNDYAKAPREPLRHVRRRRSSSG